MGLARAEHAERLVRRPTLTAPARAAVSKRRVGTKKRLCDRTKNLMKGEKDALRYRNSLTKNAPYKACSAFTRVAACTLALSPIRDTHSEGFSHFVASMTAPVASGWSGCRVGLAPTGKRRLVTAHTPSGRFDQ